MEQLHLEVNGERGIASAAAMLHKERLQVPSSDPFDPGYRRLRYVRYADDFVLGFSEPKAEARQVTRRRPTLRHASG